MVTMNKNQMIKPEQILEIISRRRWAIIPPFALALIAGIALAIVLPKYYRAYTLILIEPQRVPANFVQSIITADIESRIETISQQILSRSNLEKIIEQFRLFQGADDATIFMEDKVASLRKRIKVDVTQGSRQANAFTISYKGEDPEQVANITNALASYFIEENLKVREAQATGTSDFLEAELIIMRQRLEEKEQLLSDYRQQFMGELPEQLNSNLQILDGLQKQLSERQAALRDARSRLITLQNQKTLQANLGPELAAPRLQEPDPSNIDQLREELARLLSRYTEQHPDVQRLQKSIAELEAKIKSGALKVSGGTTQGLEELGQVGAARREIGNIEADVARIQSQIRLYENRVESTPRREQELLSLERDYDNIQNSYQSLLNRKLEAEIAVNMERKQKGEQFRVLDYARVPVRPVEPNMIRLFLITIALGVALAGGLAFLLESIDNSYRDPQDLENRLGLPVMAIIPILESGNRRMMRVLNNSLTAVSILATIVLLAGFAVLIFRGIEPTLAALRAWT